MSRTKIDYGIDLGTTNSAISRMEKGEPLIKKTDTLKDTIPSCVYINNKNSIQVGDSAYNAMKRDKLRAMRTWDKSDLNSFIEFKRTMGTDKNHYSPNLNKNLTSEDLSSEVLKKLKSFITDESVKSIVVTVPAKFTSNQKDATLRAATIAGFDHCELLQEPIAASMAYGLDANSKDGFWLVFDFGGGTFDVALLKVEEGIMKVIDTEGDNHLGGKNLDDAIVDEIIIPYFEENYVIESILKDKDKKSILQDAMKSYAEETKIQMSFNDTYNVLSDLGEIPGEDDEGEEFELDITVSQEMMKRTMGPIFQKAIDISNNLLDRNNLDGKSISSLILVGGPTFSPILRRMLEEQLTKPDLSVDPMTVVAKGAALFASTIDVSDEIREQQRDKEKIQFVFGYESTSVEEEELVTVRILKDMTTGELPIIIFVDIVRSDIAWSSGKIEIDANGEVIEVKLNSGKANAFDVLAYDDKGDLLEIEPSSFTIIQGSKIGSATLPYNFGVEVKSRTSGKVEFKSIKGLEKNQSTPAVGTLNNLKTQKQLRPGNKDDVLSIPIYQGDYGADGTRAIYNEFVYKLLITGDDLPKLLPEGSDVDLTFNVDTSERMSLSVYFPTLDYTEEIEVPSNTTQKEIDADWLTSEINKSINTINLIREEGVGGDAETLDKLDNEIHEIKDHLESNETDYDRKKDVLNSLRLSLKSLDQIQSDSEWPKMEEELKDVFYRLEENEKNFGSDTTKGLVKQFKEQIPEVLKSKNTKIAQELIDNMRQLDFSLVDEGLGAQMEVIYLNNFNDDFETLDWSDRNKARMTLDRGLQLAAHDPIKEQLRPIVLELFKLLPNVDKAIVSGDGTELVG